MITGDTFEKKTQQAYSRTFRVVWKTALKHKNQILQIHSGISRSVQHFVFLELFWINEFLQRTRVHEIRSTE